MVVVVVAASAAGVLLLTCSAEDVAALSARPAHSRVHRAGVVQQQQQKRSAPCNVMYKRCTAPCEWPHITVRWHGDSAALPVA